MAMPMGKTTAITSSLSASAGHPAVFTTGYTSRIARQVDDRPENFYMTGSMGLALSVGLGIALACRRTTLVVDGDGSLLMNPAGLITAGALKDVPLVHLVLDDGAYDSTGGQRSSAGTVDSAAWARAAGYRAAHTVQQEHDLADVLLLEMAHTTSPVFIRCLVTPARTAVPPRVPGPLTEHARTFAAFVGQIPHARSSRR